MGRGEHPWKNHHKKLNAEGLRLKAQGRKGVKRFALSVMRKKLHIGSCNKNIIGFLSDCKNRKIKKIKAYGQLVLLGFSVTTFTPVAYQRHSL